MAKQALLQSSVSDYQLEIILIFLLKKHVLLSMLKYKIIKYINIKYLIQHPVGHHQFSSNFISLNEKNPALNS